MWNKLRLALLNWGPVVFMLLIFSLESRQSMSIAETANPLQKFLDFLFGYHLPPQKWMPLYGGFRKVCHFSGYGVFSAFFFRALYLRRPPLRLLPLHLGALAATLIVASLDEWHQTFLPGRDGCPQDVLIDMSGAILVQIVLLLIFTRVSPARYAARERA